MRNLLLFFALFSVVLIGPHCVKKSDSCTPESPSSEAGTILAFASSKGLNVVVHPSGMYYEIITAGTGATPTINSNISITYSGMLMDGTVFDTKTTPNNTTADPAWPLSQLIEGWRIGIPLIKKGGRIKLIVPSSMAYGCTGRGSIPPNAVLFFDVSLVDVQ